MDPIGHGHFLHFLHKGRFLESLYGKSNASHGHLVGRGVSFRRCVVGLESFRLLVTQNENPQSDII